MHILALALQDSFEFCGDICLYFIESTLRFIQQIGNPMRVLISADGCRITMEAGEDSFEVLLYDPRNPKKRIEVKTAIKPINEARTTQPAPATPPTTEMAKAESLKKPVEPAQGRVITHASPFANKDILISRSRRSEAIHRALMASNQPNTGIVESTKENRDISSGLGKMKPE